MKVVATIRPSHVTPVFRSARLLLGDIVIRLPLKENMLSIARSGEVRPA